jgi:hypothetical protein
LNLTQVPRGINVVVETAETVFIGRVGLVDGKLMKMHHATTIPVPAGGNVETLIRQTAKFGIRIEHESLDFEAEGVIRIRRLGDVPKA